MRTNVLIIVSAVVVPVIILTEDVPKTALRNFYNNYEDHARDTRYFLENTTDHVRHNHDRKINKIKRCRRYAQNYNYQNYVPPNCFYNVCRNRYCGYCPTSSCRRRCCLPTTVVTPEPAVTSQAVKDCACDSHGSKIPACNQKGKCICKPHYIGSKCERCEDGYYKSNSECVPCQCDSEGSTTANCDPETGSCFCNLGVQGRKCDSCQDKHYGSVGTGCKACDPCEREGHICDPQNGKCVCPKLTEGPKCERCVANAWGHEPGIGCKPCGCSSVGSSTAQCDSVRGRCTCKLGFEGEKCENCSYGYYKSPNSPTCRKCLCNESGTVREDCNHGICRCSHNGCKCKPNVEGKTCNQCKKGTFGMDPENYLGCTSCFCSNRSTSCTESTYVWDQIRTDDIRKNSSHDCTNCWALPEKFSGDLIQSYGGYLRIVSDSPKHHVYLSGNKITLKAVTDSRGDIKLTEFFWRVKQPNQLVFPKNCSSKFLWRSCLMTVLQNVTAILIESKSPNIKFEEVVLDKTSGITGLPQAKSVENCKCPKEYTSSSCQDPNDGYYRYRPKQSETHYKDLDRIFGVAKPCNCNNRSRSCDKETGHCVNCEGFTTGPHCNFCAKGYYKDHQGNCSPCRCPSERQNFADNCTVVGKPPMFTCNCKSGYSGSRCDQCDEKYWGNPQELRGSCQPCNCNPYGSSDLRCDKLTGQCQCRVGFTGKQCSRCSSPRQVIQDGVCIACDECTQILFHTLDGLSDDVDKTLDLFKNGLGPPWRLLNSTLHNYTVLTNHFDDLQRAENVVKSADIPGLERRVQIIKNNLPQEEKILTEQLKKIDNIFKETKNKSKEVQNLDRKITNLIKSIDGFGKSHVDVQEALREAKELLSDIVMISQESPSTREYQNFFNKCDKFSKAVNDIYKDGFNATFLKTGLADLGKRLNHLNEELDRTKKITDLARSKNKRNSARIHGLNRTINNLNEKNSVINENISSQLDKLSATNTLLEDLAQIYKSLSTIDLKEINLDNDFEVVSEAPVRKHVEKLKDKIKGYRDIFNFTPDEWTKIDASGAYVSIVKGIQCARSEAEQARNITINALEKLYPSDDDSQIDKTNLAKAFSDRIQKRVKNLRNLTEDFDKTIRELEDLKQNILKNGKSNNELNSYLRSMLKNITQHSATVEKLRTAETRARNVSATIESIDQRLKDTNITIQYELIKTYQKYLNLLSSPEISNLTAKINQTMYQLKNISLTFLNSTYFDEISYINKNKFNSTNTNLEMLGKRIQNLTNVIQNANEVVNAVNFGVNIKQCRRSYELKNDVFRSLEIEFKCDYCSLFSLANWKNEIIKVVYGDGYVTVSWNKYNRTMPGNNTVSITRLGSSILIKTETGNATIPNENSFEIDSNHRLEIGNLSNPKATEACLRKIRLNGQTIGLWKFNTTEGNCSGCRKNDNNDGLANVFLNGNGYREVNNIKTGLKAEKFTIRFSFETFDENSLIFLAHQNTTECAYIALNLKNGYVELNVRHDNGVNVTLTLDKKYNTGKETSIEIVLSYDRKINLQNYILKHLSNESKSDTNNITTKNVYKVKQSKFFIGGVPSTHNTNCIPTNISRTSFLGNLKVSNDLQVNSQNSLSINAEPSTGKLKLSKAWFPGNGSVELESNSSTITNKTRLFFTFKPVSTMNNFVMNINNNMKVYLRNSKLVFKPQNESEVESDIITPNSFHFVELSSDGVKVDDNSRKNFSQKVPILNATNRFRLGNYTSENYLSYVGSIGDIFIDDSPILFTAATVKSFENVEIGRDRVLTVNDSTKGMQNTERYLSIPDYRTEPQAFKFGDKSNSFVFIKNTVVGKKFVMEFQFRTFYPTGLLFLSNSQTANRNFTFYTILEIQGGDIKLQVQGHKPKIIKMNEKLNDGDWHHVQVEQIQGKKKWRLIVKVDKKWKVKERGPRSNFNGDLYLGGVPGVLPVHKKIKNELHPFRGCIRSLRINKNPQVVKNNNNVVYSNIGQCFQNVEEGAYFGGDAFAIYKYGFKVNKLLELSFEFKTREPNGILLSVSNFGNSPALSVELQNGAVVMTIDMGNGIISQVTNSPHSDSTLANNEWHNITALYSSFELTVNVDGVRKSWVQSDFNSMMDEIEAPLYVGGLPSNVPSGTLKIKENFKGCIRKFKIEDNIMDWTDMKKLNNVQLNSCLA